MQARGNRGAGGSVAKKASKGKSPVGNPLTKLSTGVPQVGGNVPKKASKAASNLGNKASKTANKAASKVQDATSLHAALLTHSRTASLCLPACCVGQSLQNCRCLNVEQTENLFSTKVSHQSQLPVCITETLQCAHSYIEKQTKNFVQHSCCTKVNCPCVPQKHCD